MAMDWTTILRNAGTPEPPGREELIAKIKARPAAERIRAGAFNRTSKVAKSRKRKNNQTK